MRQADELPHIPWLGELKTFALGDAERERLIRALAADDLVHEAGSRTYWSAILGLSIAAISLLALHVSTHGGFLSEPARSAGIGPRSPVESGVAEMRGMRSLMAGVLGAGAVATSTHAQSAVQWRVEDGGNGHWYAGFPLPPSETAWGAARVQAQQRGGELACLNTSGEAVWVFQHVASNPSLWRGNFGPWTGGTRGIGVDWTWADGTLIQSPFPWALGQPDNYAPCGKAENCVVFWPRSSAGSPQLMFADFPENGSCNEDGSTVGGFLVEWSSDCNNDGLVDYGQIQTGELLDVNGNNVPDCCEQGLPCACPADIDRNGSIDGIDLAIILSKWGTNGGKDYPSADIDRSGVVDGSDLAEVLNSWGPCP